MYVVYLLDWIAYRVLNGDHVRRVFAEFVYPLFRHSTSDFVKHMKYLQK